MIADDIIPENIEFMLKDLSIIQGNQEKLSQVFQNIFENAITHGKPQKIEVKRIFNEEGSQILISNDGELIPSDNRLKIFQQSYTTKEGSSGLGLAIVKKIVETHNWQISLTNTKETTFSISIPKKC